MFRGSLAYKIPLYKPYIGNKEKELVNEALDTGWISSRGKFVDEFETKFAEYLDRKYAITTANGTVALHLALEALELEKNTAVICPTLTYVSTANAIRYAGLIPFFVDCNNYGVIDSYNICKAMERAELENIKISAIMPVHLYGNCCDIDNIKENLKLPIIEDCAESVGSTLFGRLSGSHKTEFACFSFFGNKTITTGEGGIIVCDDPVLNDKCKMLRGVGQKPISPQRYQHLKVGYNYRLTNIASAIGIAQLENINWILERKRYIAKLYKEYFKKYHFDYFFLEEPKGCYSNNWLVTMILDSNIMREGLMLYLESKEIETRPAFLPMHAMINLGKSYRTIDMKESENIASCGINLPSYPELTDNQVIEVCENIHSFIKGFL